MTKSTTVEKVERGKSLKAKSKTRINRPSHIRNLLKSNLSHRLQFIFCLLFLSRTLLTNHSINFVTHSRWQFLQRRNTGPFICVIFHQVKSFAQVSSNSHKFIKTDIFPLLTNDVSPTDILQFRKSELCMERYRHIF